MNRTDRPYAKTLEEMLRITTHPAFRLGFLDAQGGRDLDHDDIEGRILRETEPSSLAFLHWPLIPLSSEDVELAQYRYEEGRLVQIQYNLKCRSWKYPHRQPKAIQVHLSKMANAIAADGGSMLRVAPSNSEAIGYTR